MTRVCLVLLAVLMLCALGQVTGQHHARKLFAELERQLERGRQLDVEYGQLQLEASTWAMHARIERVARQSLRMRSPDSKHMQIVAAVPQPGASQPTPVAGASRPAQTSVAPAPVAQHAQPLELSAVTAPIGMGAIAPKGR